MNNNINKYKHFENHIFMATRCQMLPCKTYIDYYNLQLYNTLKCILQQFDAIYQQYNRVNTAHLARLYITRRM